jgi:hypothetical protein
MFVGMANKIATLSPLSNETGWDMVTPCNQCQHFCGHISEIDVDDEDATSEEEENENSDVETTVSVASDNGLTNGAIRSIVSREIADFATNYDDATQAHPEFLRQFGKGCKSLQTKNSTNSV